MLLLKNEIENLLLTACTTICQWNEPVLILKFMFLIIKDSSLKLIFTSCLISTLSTCVLNLTSSKSHDRNYSKEVMKQKPRLIILHHQPKDHACSQLEKTLHVRWAMDLARQQYHAGRVFLIVKEDDESIRDNPHVQHISQLPDVSFLPLEWCKYGLIGRSDNLESGIMSNIHEVLETFQSVSDSLKKR